MKTKVEFDIDTEEIPKTMRDIYGRLVTMFLAEGLEENSGVNMKQRYTEIVCGVSGLLATSICALVDSDMLSKEQGVKSVDGVCEIIKEQIGRAGTDEESDPNFIKDLVKKFKRR